MTTTSRNADHISARAGQVTDAGAGAAGAVKPDPQAHLPGRAKGDVQWAVAVLRKGAHALDKAARQIEITSALTGSRALTIRAVMTKAMTAIDQCVEDAAKDELEQHQADSEKQFTTLRALFAMQGHSLYRAGPTDAATAFYAERWGMVRYLPSLDEAGRFLVQIGGRT